MRKSAVIRGATSNSRRHQSKYAHIGHRQNAIATPTLHYFSMPFVVTDSCILCKYTTCVDVCPMNCFREGPQFLVIAPDECIDCSLCVSECPVSAIYSDVDLPAHQRHFTQLNAELAARPDWKLITRSKAPLAEHLMWRSTSDKLNLLDASMCERNQGITGK